MAEETEGGLGSLAESARRKELKTARGILFFIGVVTILANAVFAGMAKSMVDDAIDKELRELQAQGLVLDDAAVEEARTSGFRAAVTANLIGIGIGILFIAFGIFVYQKPVPITIAALVIYIGANAAYGLLDPTTLLKGLIIKIFIVAALFKAVQAAIASEKEKDTAALGPLAPNPA